MNKASQRKSHSWLETITNTAVGYVINLCANFLLFPVLLGVGISLKTNIILSITYTIISVVRGYLLRRFFNWVHVNWEKIKKYVRTLFRIKKKN